MDSLIVTIVVFLIIIYFAKTYIEMIRDKFHKGPIVYLKGVNFLLMENDGNLISLTIEKKGFDATVHYLSDFSMVVTECED